MVSGTTPDPTLLVVTNLVLGGLCLALLLTVVGGAIYELVERRRLRASLPDAWPPTPEELGPAHPSAG